jgi:murein DD-endopeptidase MepM/ murein hydrolase activator NlpD
MMTPLWDRRLRLGCALLACFCAGALADGLLRMKYVRSEPGVHDVATVRLPAFAPGASARPRRSSEETEWSGGGRAETGGDAAAQARPDRTTPAPERASPPVVAATTGLIPTGHLRVPIDGVEIEALKGGFDEHRGARPHEAVDILAPRNTPVLAVERGTIAKLFVSNAGGITVYQFDPSGRLAYYYAHLERYADGLHEGQAVAQGDVIGYVGTSGNAPPGTPHLHFAVFELDDTRRWWKGKAIDPYLVFKSRG